MDHGCLGPTVWGHMGPWVFRTMVPSFGTKCLGPPFVWDNRDHGTLFGTTVWDHWSHRLGPWAFGTMDRKGPSFGTIAAHGRLGPAVWDRGPPLCLDPLFGTV